MTEEKRQEIKSLIESRFGEDKMNLCSDIENGYIFGKYADSEHYLIDDIVAIYNEVESEQNPPRDIETEDEEEN